MLMKKQHTKILFQVLMGLMDDAPAPSWLNTFLYPQAGL